MKDDKRAVIIANGEYPTSPQALEVLRSAHYRVCCDGGADAYIERGGTPDAIVGDGDSLSEENRTRFASLIHHSPDQETNDQTKAVRWALNNLEGIESIYIIGATGGRADHTIGNAALLMEYTRMFDLNGINIESVTDNGTIFPINDTNRVVIVK
mgnify:CR=1 FL=1